MTMRYENDETEATRETMRDEISSTKFSQIESDEIERSLC